MANKVTQEINRLQLHSKLSLNTSQLDTQGARAYFKEIAE